jgi:hypothetical protein
MIDDPYREEVALATLRTRSWLIPVLLFMGLSGWAVLVAVGYGLWLLKRMAEAAAIAFGGAV